MNMRIICRPLLCFTALVPCAVVRAETAQGTLLVSVTIVSTCAVDVADALTASVDCPAASPYRVSVESGNGLPSLATGDGQVFAGSQRVELARLAQTALAMARITTAETGTASRPVTRLTISY